MAECVHGVSGSCGPARTDGWMDGQTEHGESQGDNRTGWQGSTAQTRDRLVAWIGHTELQMAGEMAGNDAHEHAAAVPCCPHVAGGDTGSQPALPPPSIPLGASFPGASSAPSPLPQQPRVAGALPETLMGTTLVCTEQDWCHCFSSTVGRGKALGQAVCLSGVVGRLREMSGGLTPSVLALLLSSSSARRLGGCGEKHESAQWDRKGHPPSCCAMLCQCIIPS